MAEIKYLEINADDRSIIIPEGENLLGVENDNKGVRKYFICPKIVGDNIDLTKSDVYINVQNNSLRGIRKFCRWNYSNDWLGVIEYGCK